MPIDTLKAAKRLQQEDTFSPEQAERIAEVLSDLDVASATKDDLDDLEERLTVRIDKVESRIDTLETRMDERFAQIDERFEQIGERFEQVDSRFDQIDNRFAQIDKRFEQVDGRFEQVGSRFEQIDRRFEQAKEEREEIEKRLTQRVELSEQRTDKQISELRSDLYRVLVLGFGGVAALVTVLNYVFG